MLAHGPTSAVLASSACQDEFSSVPLINPTKWPPATDNLHLRILDPLDFRHFAKASTTAVAGDKLRLRASSSSESFFFGRMSQWSDYLLGSTPYLLPTKLGPISRNGERTRGAHPAAAAERPFRRRD